MFSLRSAKIPPIFGVAPSKSLGVVACAMLEGLVGLLEFLVCVRIGSEICAATFVCAGTTSSGVLFSDIFVCRASTHGQIIRCFEFFNALCTQKGHPILLLYHRSFGTCKYSFPSNYVYSFAYEDRLIKIISEDIVVFCTARFLTL